MYQNQHDVFLTMIEFICIFNQHNWLDFKLNLLHHSFIRSKSILGFKSSIQVKVILVSDLFYSHGAYIQNNRITTATLLTFIPSYVDTEDQISVMYTYDCITILFYLIFLLLWALSFILFDSLNPHFLLSTLIKLFQLLSLFVPY